ncbi:DNA adenine methylase [Methanoculleus sp. FWC-SCC1]|uniref:site-specific DNA-methyltransferase (adenine-specific) n=1 Tax=Methanoculleus frigidifontis TaxID=2584085 RepID=A0ABT8MB00_9EURY|nr:DNA adenine methylase [Methanoculleus sp. FWC-SCC1]MDN7025110.1 DNA adenine methylase [Methanoculleus sp. FWC-SCC1]
MRVQSARPFLKWAGGKGQLLREFAVRLPRAVKEGRTDTYVEPFVGGGAVYFCINNHYAFDECHIFDINEELVLAYTVVRNDVEELIEVLRDTETAYLELDTKKRQEFFYTVRTRYNGSKASIRWDRYGKPWIQRAADLIFLNRTCFNGLFRVNSEGGFNVPFGRYKNPQILNQEVLRSDSVLLENTSIHLGDFADSARYVDANTFVYFDPPYRPLNRTSRFTSYSKDGFGDDDQRRLAKYFHELDARGAQLMLSNSDPKNEDPNDHFFEDLYPEYTIERVSARRMINSNGERRGEINELIITNYSTDRSGPSVC